MHPGEVPAELVQKAAESVRAVQKVPFVGPKQLSIARAVLAAVIPDVQAQALKDAADEVSGYAWQNGDVSPRVIPIEEQPAYMCGANDAHTIVDRLIRERAAHLTATTEDPPP